MANVNIALELFGVVISAILIICCFTEITAKDRQTKIYIEMLIINIVVLLCDAATWAFECKSEFSSVLCVANFLVYSLGYVLAALYSTYLIELISKKRKISVYVQRSIYVVCYVAILMVVLNNKNHMYYSFTNGIYVRGPLFWLSQFFSIVIVLVDVLIILINRKVLGIHDTISLLSFGFFPAVAMVIQIIVFGVTLLYISTTLSLMLIYITILVEQSRRIERQEAELIKANVAIMLSQIQPHFLYNAFTSISRLCDINPQIAKKATIEFAKYIRGNINSLKQMTPVNFETELSHIKIYLYLEKMRFQDRLNIVYSIKTKEFMVPSLSVQPVVEYSVRYGICRKEEGGTVEISTWEDEKNCYISVSDDGVGFDPYETQYDGRTHIGFDNVKNRLSTMCQGKIVIKSEKEIGTTFTISLPKGVVKYEDNSCR